MRIGSDLRVVLVIASVLTAQFALAPSLTLFGVTPDLLLLTAIAGGMVGGAERGAAIGFGAGLAMDLIVETPFGLWTFTSCLLAWLVGQLHGQVLVAGPLLRWVTALWASAAGLVLFVAAGLIIGQEYLAEVPLVKVVVVVSVLNAFLIPFAVRVMRWALEGTVAARAVRA